MGNQENSKKLFGYIFAGLVLVGFILAIVGMFVGQLTTDTPLGSETVKLFDEGWGVQEIAGQSVGVSNTFAIISYIVTIVGALILLVDFVLALFLNKKVKFLRLIGAVITLIGAVLVLVSGLIIVNDMWDVLTIGGGDKATLQAAGMSLSCGAGVWLAFIGGLIAAVAGGVSTLKTFA